ncbi:MAG: DnaB-like helicase C-terminal domain-containing protein [Bacteroidales bacterium]|nr:DnaB-like helicase C-terminal domain-containing protein [Bacteroidales bacterium]
MSNNTLENTQSKGVFASVQELMSQTLNPNYLNTKSPLPDHSITTGFHAIDKITKGFKSGELITIAVRPGIGKTSFLLSMINNICLCENHNAGVFSAERTGKQFMKRLIQSTSGVSMAKINKDELSEIERNHVKSIINSIGHSNLIIDDQVGISSDTISEKAREMVKLGAEIIFIDYLELLHSNSTHTNCENDDLCNVVIDLKKLAEEINIPIVLFSQLKKPITYDNKYKYTPDYVNNNTDTLIFLNRPSFYHINQIEHKSEDTAEITIAKNINIGDMQVAKLRIIESLGQFRDLN